MNASQSRICQCLIGAAFLMMGLSASAQTFTGDVSFTAYTYENGADGSLISPGQAFYDKRGGELFVASPGNHRVIIYGPDLTPKFSFQHFVFDNRLNMSRIGEPKSVVVNSQGDMFIVDNLADYVDVLDFRGLSLERIYPNRLMNDTTLSLKADLVTIDDQENIYLSVTGDLQVVLVLDKSLQLKREILRRGSSPDVVNLPLAMTVYDSMLVVSDLHGIPAIRVYDTLGQYLFGFGGREIERSDFSLPVAITVAQDSAGGVYFLIADALRQVVKLLDGNGKQIANIGGFGAGLGAFQYPSGLAFDGNRTFFVVERVSSRIQRFTLR